MKNYIISIFCVFIAFTSVQSQVPEVFSYQTILKDNNGYIIASHNVIIQVSILLGSENGSEVFTEDHSLTTTENGLINIKVGSVEDLGVVNWSEGKYFLRVSCDGNLVETKEILSVPYSHFAEQCDSTESIDISSVSNLPDFSNWDHHENDDFDGRFNSLLMWSSEDRSLYYNQGSVSIGGSIPANFGGEALRVNGAILYNGGVTDTVSGALFYDPSGNGTFRYFDNAGMMKVIGMGTITFTNPDPPVGDVVINGDTEWKNRVCLGNGGYPGYNFGENVFVMASDTLRIYFFDTSVSSSFPSTDWQLVFNDLEIDGANYFSISDIYSARIPFKIMAGAPSESLFIDENSNVGIGTDHPSEKLDVVGDIIATNLIGNGSGLSGLPGATGNTENIGSTTIGADSDKNNSGQIEFQTKLTTKLFIKNDGKIKMGSSNPLVDFDAADKNAKINSIEVSGNMNIQSYNFSIITETNPGGTSLNYDVASKRTIIFDSAIGALIIRGFQNGVIGQKITIINKSAYQAVSLVSFSSGSQIILNPGIATYTLNQNESATYIFDGYYWNCSELVH